MTPAGRLPELNERARDWARRITESRAYGTALVLALVSLPGLLVTALVVVVVTFSWTVSPAFAGIWAMVAAAVWIISLGSLAAAVPREKRWDRKLRKIMRKAEHGDRDAILALALAHEEGHHGFRPDPSQAVWWLRRLAERGDAEAAYRLSQLLHRGRGLMKDREGARAWLRAAAEAGSPEARRDLQALEDSAKKG